MNNQDPIADMLTRIRNANRVGRRMVMIPNSKICSGIAAVLKDEGYIDDFDLIEDQRQGVLRKFKISRIMLRELALAGKIPGLKKASW